MEIDCTQILKNGKIFIYRKKYVVKGASLERLVQMTNLDHQDGIMRLARKLKNLGVDDALRAKGAVDGDDVAIGDFSFEFVQ